MRCNGVAQDTERVKMLKHIMLAIANMGAAIKARFTQYAPDVAAPLHYDPAPLGFVPERRDYYNASAHWCANNVGIGYKRPACIAADGYFWRKDRAGEAWRLYRKGV